MWPDIQSQRVLRVLLSGCRFLDPCIFVRICSWTQKSLNYSTRVLGISLCSAGLWSSLQWGDIRGVLTHDAMMHMFFSPNSTNASGSLTRYRRWFGDSLVTPWGYWWHAFLLGRSGRQWAKNDIKTTKRLGIGEKDQYFSWMPLCTDRTNPVLSQLIPIFCGRLKQKRAHSR